MSLAALRYFSCDMQTLSCGMWDLVPWPGAEPLTLPWEHRSLAAGPLGSPYPLLFQILPCMAHFRELSSPMLYSKSLLVIYFIHESEVAQLWPTLCDPQDCSPPGSSVHGIFQARILEQVAISSSRRSSWPREWTCVSPALQADSLPSEPSGKPHMSATLWHTEVLLLNLNVTLVIMIYISGGDQENLTLGLKEPDS